MQTTKVSIQRCVEDDNIMHAKKGHNKTGGIYTCCGGYDHEPKGTSHYIFSHSHSVVGPNPIYVHVYTFPLVQGSTYWCHVSFPLVMGDLMISEEKEGSWKEQRWLKAKCM